MASISENDVRHVAMLARLGLNDARVRELTRDLGAILEHMEVLDRVNTDRVNEFGMDHAVAAPLRQDVAVQQQLAPSALALAPESRDGFFLVPRLSTHDDATPDGAP